MGTQPNPIRGPGAGAGLGLPVRVSEALEPVGTCGAGRRPEAADEGWGCGAGCGPQALDSVPEREPGLGVCSAAGLGSQRDSRPSPSRIGSRHPRLLSGRSLGRLSLSLLLLRGPRLQSRMVPVHGALHPVSPAYEDSPGMKSRAHIDFISKLLINFTAWQKYCIVQLGQIQTALPPASRDG